MIEFLSEHWVMVYGFTMYAIGILTGWSHQCVGKAIEKYADKLNYDEWCHNCKEYDQERHCCPRFNKVIRKTVEEMKNEGDSE